jgi:hypothetical protein
MKRTTSYEDKDFLGRDIPPIDLSKMPDFKGDEKTDNIKRSRQVADGAYYDNMHKDGILYSLLDIEYPFNIHDEYNTISSFWNNNSEKYPQFKDLLDQYVRNAHNERNIERAKELKKIIMQFIADKMNNV